METLQAITLEKSHYPTAEDAIAFLLNYGVSPDYLDDYDEIWRHEKTPLSENGKARIENIGTGAIAVYQADMEMDDDDGDGGIFPKPTPEELKKIQALAPNGITYKAEELVVVTLYASDNLIQRSNEKWSLNCLQQMAARSAGTKFIPDHNWHDSDGAMGMVFDTMLEELDPTNEVLAKFGNQKFNRKIVKSEGYWRLSLKVFLSADSKKLEDIKYRRLYDLSTGGLWKTMPKYLCPNCTAKLGEPVSFHHDDTCPHDFPSAMSLFFWGDEADWNFADYILVDGEIYPTEISSVVVGDLPAAAIV